ncbi:MAG: type II toxin-antitoxin system prevent-host-death family antitoxin [Gammaproteobacteria bacterium]
MQWSIAQAKQKFSDVVRRAGQEPQLIFNRDRMVAAVVDPDTFEAFQSWQKREQSRTLADAFAELRQIAAEEAYTLEIPLRSDRRNAFADLLDSVSR